MTIKGISNQRLSFPRIGILRKGAKKMQDNKPGADLKYLRFVSDDVDANRMFLAAYGPEPRRINVLFPFATTDENLEMWMELHGSGSLKHRCDRDTAVLWQDSDGTYRTDPVPCPSKAAGLQGKPGGCRPAIKVHVVIPELRRIAEVVVLSGAWNDAVELDGNLRAAEDTAHALGMNLCGLPFVLSRVEREISTPPREKGGKRMRSKKSLLHLEIAPSHVGLLMDAARKLATPRLSDGEPVRLLSEPSYVDEDEEEDEDAGTGELVDPGHDDQSETETQTQAQKSAATSPDQLSTGANGKELTRPNVIARLRELADELSAHGQMVNLDTAWLREAPLDELVQHGKRLRANMDALKAAGVKQAALEF